MPKLIIQSGGHAAREFALQMGVNSVGRGDANRLQIQDPSISTNHAEIIVEGNGVWVRDLGSTNGSFIGPARISEAALQPGQRLRLGSVELILEDDLPVAVAVTSPPPPVVVAAAVAPEPVRVRVPAPAAASGLAQAPAGKTACKFHPQSAGEWLCQKCNELFCSGCVNLRRTGAGANAYCRKCGGACVPVKVNFVAPREKTRKSYSDGAILVRCLVFGLAAALLSAGIWVGLSCLFGFDILFLFLPMVAAICGYAVKLANQDRPGGIYSGIAIGYFLLGSVLGKAGMIAVTHLTFNTATVYMTGGLGLAAGVYVAWKLGGGE